MSIWMTDGRNTWAYVPDEQVDDWTVRGWSPAGQREPMPSDWVWLEHTGDGDGHGGRQKFAAGAAAVWMEMGWSPSPPEEPVDVTRDRRLLDVPAELPVDDEPAEVPAEILPQPDPAGAEDKPATKTSARAKNTSEKGE